MNIGVVQSQLQMIQTGENKKNSESKNIKTGFSSSNPKIKEVPVQNITDKYANIGKVNLDSSKVSLKDVQSAQEQLGETRNLMKDNTDSALAAQSKADPKSVLHLLS